jgi:hypothetical protein
MWRKTISRLRNGEAHTRPVQVLNTETIALAILRDRAREVGVERGAGVLETSFNCLGR